MPLGAGAEGVSSIHDVQKSSSRGLSVADIKETGKMLSFIPPTETEGGSAVLKGAGPRPGQRPFVRGLPGRSLTWSKKEEGACRLSEDALFCGWGFSCQGHGDPVTVPWWLHHCHRTPPLSSPLHEHHGPNESPAVHLHHTVTQLCHLAADSGPEAPEGGQTLPARPRPQS